MTERDNERLVGVHPELVGYLVSIFDIMEAEGNPMFVVKGVRTQLEQQALYSLGRSKPGQIVTFKDGITHKSEHQAHDDGFGHAVDCAFLGPQPLDSRHPWEMYGEEVERKGLTWGGRWTFPHDGPHAELPDKPVTDEERTVFP